MVGLIDSDNTDCNRIATSYLKLSHLILEVVYYAIDLFDHRISQDLDFGSDLHCSDWTAGDRKAGKVDRYRMWDQLAKGSISTTCIDATQFILHVKNMLFCVYGSIEFFRTFEGVQIFWKAPSNRVTKA